MFKFKPKFTFASVRADWITKLSLAVAGALVTFMLLGFEFLYTLPTTLDQWIVRLFIVICCAGFVALLDIFIRVFRNSTIDAQNTLAEYGPNWAMNGTEQRMELYEVGLADQVQQAHEFSAQPSAALPTEAKPSQPEHPIPRIRIRHNGHRAMQPHP